MTREEFWETFFRLFYTFADKGRENEGTIEELRAIFREGERNNQFSKVPALIGWFSKPEHRGVSFTDMYNSWIEAGGPGMERMGKSL
jgi:hypothetical protein